MKKIRKVRADLPVILQAAAELVASILRRIKEKEEAEKAQTNI